MKIIPDTSYDNNSFAEQQVFSELKSMETDYYCVAFHSIMLPNHAYKRSGEVDFVIVSRYGVFVLEVKGGAVSYRNGVWTTQNKNGIYEIADPFKQANSAMHAINEKITAYLTLKEARLPLGYGVIFPDVQWNYEGMEWESEIICDANGMLNFPEWIATFFEYWHDRPANANFLSKTDVDKIVDFLRPSFEFVQPLFSQVMNVQQHAVSLTKEQYHYVDMAMANKRVICSGGAGTGKTFLALELCQRFILQGKTVLLTCHSSWLRHYLSTLISSNHIIISTISGLSTTMKREGIDIFDVLVVDEGQDLLNIDGLERLDKVLDNGLLDGHWYFFHDMNNQSNVLTELDERAMVHLKENNNPSIFNLSINCRNTQNILTKIQDSLHCDLGKPTLIEGPEVTEFYGNQSQLILELSNLLKELMACELDNGSITILSSVSKTESLLSLLPKSETTSVLELDDYKVRSYPFAELTFANIANFKGLENDVIILLDLYEPSQLTKNDSKSLYYIGMSRARAKLYCFWNDSNQIQI